MTDKELLYAEAKRTINNAYAPYSNYKVSAALLLADSLIISSQNVENASYGLTVCAERNVLFKAISLGYKKEDIKAMLIYVPKENNMPYPCGACRQVMVELMKLDSTIYISNDSVIEEHKLSDFMPYKWELE